MAYNPFTGPTLSGYNASPPPDDGSATEANRLTWAKGKSKLADPLKTYADAIKAAVSTAFGSRLLNAVNAQTSTYTVQTSDAGKVVKCTGTFTVTLPALATVDTGWPVVVYNAGSGTITVDGDGSEQINGATTLVLEEGQGAFLASDAASWVALVSGIETAAPRGHLSGCVPSNDTDTDHDILISAGQATLYDGSDYSSFDISAITKQIDANWSAGDDAGGFPSGLTLSNNTWYHLFLIGKADGTVDAGFDTSLTAANLLSDATGYAFYRRIGSVATDGSANIVAFVARELHGALKVEWKDPPLDQNGVTLPTASSTSYTLSVPTGLAVEADLNVAVNRSPSGNAIAYLRTPDITDEAPAKTSAPLATVGGDGVNSIGRVGCWTNTSSQVAARAFLSSTVMYIATVGWLDPRNG